MIFLYVGIYHHLGVACERHRSPLEAFLCQFFSEFTEPELPATTVICANGPHSLDNRSHFPDRTRGLLGKLRAFVPHLCEGGLFVVALSRRGVSGACSNPAGIEDGGATRGPPWVELRPVIIRADAVTNAFAAIQHKSTVKCEGGNLHRSLSKSGITALQRL